MGHKSSGKKKLIPKVLLIGAGRFGRHHLRVLKELSAENAVDFVGVVERNAGTRKILESEFGVKTFATLSPALLKSVDAVDVVTPPETHFEIVKNCLRHTNVFCEKPLATTEKDSLRLATIARDNKRLLAVGHIFRYHPVSENLKKILQNKGIPKKIRGQFINPLSTDQGREPSIELLHLFDVIDFLWNKKAELIHSKKEGRVSVVDMRYSKLCDAHFVLGWRGEEKKRSLTFIYPNGIVEADFLTNTVSVADKNKSKVYQCPIVIEPLRKELTVFISSLSTSRASSQIGKQDGFIDAKKAAEIVSIAEQAIPKQKSAPRVAVIGGGIFGTSIAAELGKFCSVTLFEKNCELMMEGSFINQFRHHYGYHYPRSDETVMEVQESRDDFEEIFQDAIVRTTPTYYGLSKKNSRVSPAEFIAFCKKHSLPYKLTYPPTTLLEKKELSLCVEVPEPSYHHGKLKDITETRLGSMSNIRVLCDTKVTDVVFEKGEKKEISYITNTAKGKKEKTEEFDFVINATYANMNHFANWLDFENFAIRVDRAEVLIVKLQIPPISLTVIDGEFPTLMPTGNPHEFTLYHARESILDRYVPKNGLIKKNARTSTNREAILRESMRLLPILKDAEVVESRIVHRGVMAHREHDDVRIVNLIEHGFGCWSVLSGKILTSVSAGKKLAEIIRRSTQ